MRNRLTQRDRCNAHAARIDRAFAVRRLIERECRRYARPYKPKHSETHFLFGWFECNKLHIPEKNTNEMMKIYKITYFGKNSNFYHNDILSYNVFKMYVILFQTLKTVPHLQFG